MLIKIFKKSGASLIIISMLINSLPYFFVQPAFAVVTATQAPAATCDYYAAPNGTSGGTGSVNSPWDIQTALNATGTVTSGKTLCLKGGTYTGRYSSSLVGATVRSAPGEWAKLDSNYAVTLTSTLTSSTSTVPCTFSSMANGIIGGSGVLIDNENVFVSQSGANYLCIRARSGTTVAAHSSGTATYSLSDALVINGSATIYRDFEIMNSDTQRVYASNAVWKRRDVLVYGPNTKLVNLIVHDLGDGIFESELATGSEVYGVVTYNNGFSDSLRGHGHGLYMQNEDASQPKAVTNVISFNNFATGMKAFGVSGPARGFTFDGNISFNNGSPAAFPGNPSGFSAAARETNIFVGPGSQPASSIIVRNNATYTPDDTQPSLANVAMGWSSVRNEDLLFQNNYVIGGKGGLDIEYWNSATVTGNTVYSGGATSAGSYIINAKLDSLTNWVWNSNTYFDSHPVSSGAQYDIGLILTGTTIRNSLGGGILTYNQADNGTGKGWKQWTGFDANSTINSGKPTQNRVFIYPNAYQPGRANIAAYNWTGSLTASVDLSQTGLTNGQQYSIVKSDNYFGTAVASGTYNSSSPVVSVTMSDATVATPIGHSFTPASTCPEFCSFVVIPGGFVDSTPPSSTLVAPLNGAAVSGTVTLSATATDNMAVAGVQFKLDGANLGSEITTAPYNATWDTTTVSDGSHTITASARDTTNNVTISAVATVTVSNTPVVPDSGGGGGGGSGGASGGVSSGGSGGSGNGSSGNSTTDTVPVPGVVNVPTTTIDLPADSNFQCDGSGTVYFYRNGKKQGYPDQFSYEVWNGKNYASIIKVSASYCSSIQDEGTVRLPERTIIKISSAPTVYAIEGNTARPFATLQALRNYMKDAKINIISLGYLHTYSRGPDIK